MTRSIMEADLPDVQVTELSVTKLFLMDLIWKREVERAPEVSSVCSTHNAHRDH